MIYIDTNVLYSYLFETPISENAERILELPEKVTSKVAINEAVYVVFRRLARDKGITNVYEAKKFAKLKEGQYLLEQAYSTVMELVQLSGITVVEEEDDFEILKDISREYGLLPNDAIIVATCVKHGITKIATFDSDFDNVPFLKIVRG
ncbi:predicted nucleic acid-binding protein, containing PIN domain [Thermococcus kodakarensis KOD1]|uniref:Ribonuclease VapC n=1 Tax=Thermococcus kodakarensis (strain ATCC BAA-918 / JCM 12380 / KOD1) TaxID=69014 RepID=Q5JIU2_THEKO|nr:PIN domain-containing protein [Thermococcus kodakarensis]WCN27574.1 PIN domain-containing protein [Thermococcus kodakarensis]WCN29865.1 PIN domain-containing protein [Thermococcus kodakarensis]BAD85833.1 predicted nucleic acid-binding protein, containing PIN domain [Thermococcus kodakarensis KOD1]